MKPTLRLREIGQIKEADICFGDLTVLVGPQASGKSIALQWLKLVCDLGHVRTQLQLYGFDWDKDFSKFLDLYFGEGMCGTWIAQKSQLHWEGKPWNPSEKLARRAVLDESVFLIPAQRVLTLRDGWPRPFSDYSPGDPFSVRCFSENLRILMEKDLGMDTDVFPKKKRLTSEYRTMLETSVFGDFLLTVDKSRSQKRLVLERNGASQQLPFMVWSAGQREFVPLLLGLYWLLPSAKIPMREKLKWVIIEEPEMGMHPRAITTILLLVLELLHRGYRVCISTHSPQVLELVWAIRTLKEAHAKPNQLLGLFNAQNSQKLSKVAKSVLSKELAVYYFGGKNGIVNDISGLDPGSQDTDIALWGGLLEFSGRANNVVANAMANVSDAIES